jgi:putative endonuclease
MAREKQLKNWQRKWKDELIKKENPELKDLSQGWYH